MKPQTYRRRVMASDLPAAARAVGHVIASFADFQTGAVSITLDRIQLASGYKSKDTVRDAVEQLVAAGFLIRMPSGSRRKPTRYRLDAPYSVVQSLDHPSSPDTGPLVHVDNQGNDNAPTETSGPVSGPLSGPVLSGASGPVSGPLYGRDSSSPTSGQGSAPAAAVDPASRDSLVLPLAARLVDWDR